MQWNNCFAWIGTLHRASLGDLRLTSNFSFKLNFQIHIQIPLSEIWIYVVCYLHKGFYRRTCNSVVYFLSYFLETRYPFIYKDHCKWTWSHIKIHKFSCSFLMCYSSCLADFSLWSDYFVVRIRLFAKHDQWRRVRHHKTRRCFMIRCCSF